VADFILFKESDKVDTRALEKVKLAVENTGDV
jgi:hypothetical protein